MDPECTQLFGKYFVMWQEQRLLLLVFFAGVIGALLHALRALVSHVGNRDFVVSWIPFYLLWPFAGAMIAFIAYIAIRGGFFSSGSGTDQTNPFMFVTLGALSGLFSQQVLEKLKTIAETAFQKAPASNPKAAIAKLTPDKVAVNFAGPVTIDGSGFGDKPAVRAGGASMTITSASDKQIVFTLPATSTATAGTVNVVVTPAGGTASDGKGIVVG
jgi:hypothetical protein